MPNIKVFGRRGKISRNVIQENLWGYFFVFPALFFFAIFMLYPLIDSFILSFTNYSLGVEETRFVGIENYIKIFKDPIFLKVLLNTFVYVLIVVPATVMVALFFADQIIKRSSRSQTFFRVAFYLPVVLSTVTIALVWNNIYSKAFGSLNYLLSIFGGEAVNWLGDGGLVKVSLSMVIITFTLGQPLIMNLAAIGSIPETYSEAAYIDGASEWQRFWKITFPLLKPTTLYITVTTTIKAFQVFAIIKLMTGGGPNYASDTIVSFIYRVAFTDSNLSLASTMGVVLTMLIGVFAIFQFKVLSADNVEY